VEEEESEGSEADEGGSLWCEGMIGCEEKVSSLGKEVDRSGEVA
jgi:hypothetical protein